MILSTDLEPSLLYFKESFNCRIQLSLNIVFQRNVLLCYGAFNNKSAELES